MKNVLNVLEVVYYMVILMILLSDLKNSFSTIKFILSMFTIILFMIKVEKM